jgi:hypothetical protein
MGKDCLIPGREEVAIMDWHGIVVILSYVASLVG